MNALDCSALRVVLGGRRVLDDLCLTVAKDELFVLLGPSGSGKSTFLRALAGLDPCTAERLDIGGRDVRALAPERRNVAMVFQCYALYPHLTIRENLAFPLRIAGLARAEIESRIRDAVRLLRIEALLDRRPRTLSGGERQRVAIGRAIVRRPDLFLLDEPLSNLDAPLRASMRFEIGSLFRQIGGTAILVTHDQVEAMTLASRIAVMRDGRIEQIGRPTEIYDRPATLFVAGFVGSPKMNLVPGRIEANRFHGDAEGDPIPLPADDGPLTIGIRPEDLAWRADGAAGVFIGNVEVVEDVGSDVYLHVRSGAVRLVARVARTGPHPRISDSIRLEPRTIHAFDSNGVRID